MSNIKKTCDLSTRHTKLVCTLGPACWEVAQLEKLLDGGMNIARLNFSHGDHESHLACLKRLREAAKNKGRDIAVMLDTKGPEIRTGHLANGAKSISLLKGESITLTTDYSFKGNNKKLACSYSALATSVNVGQSVLIADGSLVLIVTSVNVPDGEVTCEIQNNATIGATKNMNLPGVIVDLPTLTEKDINDIKNFAVKYDVDFIAASFVRKSSDIHIIKEQLGEHGQHIKIIAKIENLEGLQNYTAIMRASDAIMVARGDLGMEIPSEKVFLAQKYMIREANIHGKPVIVATQMLESMIHNPRPTRAECSDVANAVFDGTDCVMLSGETANSPYFADALNMLARTCCEAESVVNFGSLHLAVRNTTRKRFGILPAKESIASSAVMTAYDVKAKIILVMSETGSTARQIAKFRPSMPICVLTPSKSVAKQCIGILKGVFAFQVDSLESTDKLVQETTDEVVKAGVAKEGDLMVVVCGKTFGMGATNQVAVETIKMNYWNMPAEHHSSSHDVGREGEDDRKGCIIS